MARHHFIPQFYLKKWALNHDKRIVTFRRVHKQIVSNPYMPRSVGYEDNLYGHIEKQFLSRLDNDASSILAMLGKSQITSTPKSLNLGEDDHKKWAQFILAFMLRMPDKIKALEKRYETDCIGRDIALDQIPNMITWKRAIKDLRNLKWVFARIDGSYRLLTSDRPLIFEPNNLAHPDCLIILPLGPNHFFLASPEKNLTNLIQDPSEMARYINTKVVKQADQRVYATSETDVEVIFLERNMRGSGTPI